MRTAVLRVAIVALVLAGPWVASARALSPVHPFSYRVASANGEYVFVMILEGEEPERGGEERAREAREIRARYSRSGLYRKGSNVPLWTVNWYSRGVRVASDGVHLVRPGSGHVWSDDAEAVSFFASGQLLRAYQVRELVWRFKALPYMEVLPHRKPLYSWLARDVFDEEGLTYTVWTEDGREILFDVRTGAILSATDAPERTKVIGIVVCACAAGALGAWLVWRRYRRRGPPSEASSPERASPLP